MTYYNLIESPIGQLLVTSDGQSLTGLYMENHNGGRSISPEWKRDPSKFLDVERQLSAYFKGDLGKFELDLRMEGTEFQESVWELLKAIPFGETTSYGQLARKLGAPNASRAVGAAVGKNPISIIVPCHRVLGSGGAITGFAGGIGRKRHLLDLESKVLIEV